ncbi:unnamed protein product, partial [Prorocentrum cordatum]
STARPYLERPTWRQRVALYDCTRSEVQTSQWTPQDAQVQQSDGRGRRKRERERRKERGGRAGRESGNGNARGHPPLTLPLTCAPAAAVPAPSAPGTPGAPARAGPRISVQSTAALRGGASLGAGAEVESPRAARGGGSRTAGSRQTSRTAPGARVQRASSDPRGTTQPARALHNARDADEMVMAE